MNTNLTVEARTGTNAAIRANGSIPAVVYGPKHQSEGITLSKIAFEKILKEAGESTILTLEGLAEAVEVLIHDVAFDPARGGVSHVDFYAIERGKELTTNVSLEFIGEAPVEKSGAMVMKVLQEVEVVCLPRNLPGNIEVDLTVLTDEASQITVADLTVGEGGIISQEPEAVVATVAAARTAEPEETESTEVDMGAVEVEGEKPADEAEAAK